MDIHGDRRTVVCAGLLPSASWTHTSFLVVRSRLMAIQKERLAINQQAQPIVDADDFGWRFAPVPPLLGHIDYHFEAGPPRCKVESMGVFAQGKPVTHQ